MTASEIAIDPSPRWRDTFHAGRRLREFYIDTLMRHVSDGGIRRVLDIGCGTGTLLFDLAARWPDAHLMGIDVSAASIEVARERAARLGLERRITFDAADYTIFDPGVFDLVMDWDALQFVPAPPENIAAKLAKEVAPGGRFTSYGAFRCPYNIAMAAGRSLAHAIRTRALDRTVLRIAGLLYRNDMTPSELRERLEYMYTAPNFWSNALGDALEAERSFVLEKRLPAPQTSIAQLKHRVAVYRRSG